jgi:AcrR family transcriptional regulator
MTAIPTLSAPRPPGRPRSSHADAAIVNAVLSLLAEGTTVEALTMEAVAARAGVGKATIYKWWPSRGAVALDGFLDKVAGTLAIPEGMTSAEALRWQLDALVTLFRDTTAGPLMRALVAAAQSDPDIARSLRDRWLAPRRAVSLEILRAGVARGELRSGLDCESVLDSLFAPVYQRLFFGHADLSADLAATLVTQITTGIAANPSQEP